MINRRRLLQALPALPLACGLIGSSLIGEATGSTLRPHLAGQAQDRYRDYFKELGVRTFINAAGTLTALSGSLMPDEVVEAIDYARREFVRLDDIEDKVSERIAALLGTEYATVTSGAFSAMTLGTAGVLCGLDEKKILSLPDTSWFEKNEVIKMKGHTAPYARAVRNTGAKVIEVEDRKELEAAINEKTAMLFFINTHNDDSPVHVEEFVAIARSHGIPALNDCAADVPPVENLWKYTDMGYDLVCFSGGKALRGPQSAGLLLGRADLITAARLHAPPRGNTIGRGMKVNKEEILGMLVALEVFPAKDHEAEWELFESQIQHINDAVKTVPGTETEYYVPEIANHTPSLRISWDQDRIKITPDEVQERLRAGHPSIETGGGRDGLNVSVWMMRPGEERIVAERIRDVLADASENVATR